MIGRTDDPRLLPDENDLVFLNALREAPPEVREAFLMILSTYQRFLHPYNRQVV